MCPAAMSPETGEKATSNGGCLPLDDWSKWAGQDADMFSRSLHRACLRPQEFQQFLSKVIISPESPLLVRQLLDGAQVCMCACVHACVFVCT